MLLAAVFWLQPRAMSYVGLNLLFNLAVPIALATIAQMMIIMVNDIDLSIGTFVSSSPASPRRSSQTRRCIGMLILAGAGAGLCGARRVIYALDLPAIVVTLGMSFVWGGLAVLILPAPGGTAPDWLRALMTLKPPLVPMAIVAASIIVALVAHCW